MDRESNAGRRQSNLREATLQRDEYPRAPRRLPHVGFPLSDGQL